MENLYQKMLMKQKYEEEQKEKLKNQEHYIKYNKSIVKNIMKKIKKNKDKGQKIIIGKIENMFQNDKDKENN